MSDLPAYSHDEIKQLLAFYDQAVPDEGYTFKATCRQKSITATYGWSEPRPVMGGAASVNGGLFPLLHDAPTLVLQLLAQLDELMAQEARR